MTLGPSASLLTAFWRRQIAYALVHGVTDCLRSTDVDFWLPLCHCIDRTFEVSVSCIINSALFSNVKLQISLFYLRAFFIIEMTTRFLAKQADAAIRRLPSGELTESWRVWTGDIHVQTSRLHSLYQRRPWSYMRFSSIWLLIARLLVIKTLLLCGQEPPSLESGASYRWLPEA